MFKALIIFLAASFIAFDDSRESTKPIQLIPEAIASHSSPIFHMMPGLKGKVLYTADRDNGLHAWDIKKGKFLWDAKDQSYSTPPIGMGVGKDHITLIHGVPSFGIYDIEDGSALPGAVGVMHTGSLLTMVFDPKGKWLWLSTSKGGAIRLTPGNVNGYSQRSLPNKGTMCMALGPKAKVLALGGQDGSVRFIEAGTTKKDEKKIFEVFDKPVSAIKINPKGKLLAVASESGDLHIVSLKKGKLELELEGHKDLIYALAFDPKGRWLASGDTKGNIHLWDLKKGGEPATFKTKLKDPVSDLHFLGKGEALVSASGGTDIQLWDLSEL